MRTLVSLCVASWCCIGLTVVKSAEPSATFKVIPESIELKGPFDRVQVIVSQLTSDNQVGQTSRDLTSSVAFKSDEGVVNIDASGLITARGNGTGHLAITFNGQTQSVPVKVSGFDGYHQVDFLKDVRPVFGKAGCAAAACHAAQHGKGGFKLSVFGYDPVADYEQLAVAVRGRRINPARPDGSLILEKATARVPHGGGQRIDSESLDYQLVRSWIASGAPKSTQELKIERLDVFPTMRVMQPKEMQQLRVIANYSDGSQRDVTALALYDAIDSSVVNVTPRGLTTAYNSGQSSVMVRYDGQVTTSTFMVPFAEQTPPEQWVNQNFVDELAAKKFADLGLKPSPVCDDATFARRAFLDAIGSLPEPAEITNFLQSTAANKRELLVDSLLGLTGDPAKDIYNDRYSAFWTLRWSDLIRNNSNSLGPQGMWLCTTGFANRFAKTNRTINL